MPGPQFIALAVGFVAIAALAVFFYADRAVKQRATARALELLGHGTSAADVQARLIYEGNDAELAANLLEKLLHRLTLAEPTAMLEAGQTKKEILEAMLGRGLDETLARETIDEAASNLWFRRWRLLLIPAGLAVCIAGVGLAFFGLVLRDGNLSGKWVTVPFAGGFTIMVGASVIAVGLTVVALALGKTG